MNQTTLSHCMAVLASSRPLILNSDADLFFVPCVYFLLEFHDLMVKQ